jgi:hypothetical protein
MILRSKRMLIFNFNLIDIVNYIEIALTRWIFSLIFDRLAFLPLVVPTYNYFFLQVAVQDFLITYLFFIAIIIQFMLLLIKVPLLSFECFDCLNPPKFTSIRAKFFVYDYTIDFYKERFFSSRVSI